MSIASRVVPLSLLITDGGLERKLNGQGPKSMQSIAVRRNLLLCITVHSLLFIIKKGEDHG